MITSFAEKIALLNQATLHSLTERDKLKIVQRFTQSALKMVGADFGFAWWRTSTDAEYELAYMSPDLPYNPKPPRKKGGNYKAQKSGSPVFIEHAHKEQYAKQYDVRPYMKSYVIIPIMFENRSYGNMVVCFKRQHNFSQQERSLCEAVGNAMAQAMTINKLHYNLREIKYTLDHILDPVLIFDPVTWRISYFNKGTSIGLHLTAAQLRNVKIWDVIHPSFHKTFEEHIAKIIKEKIASSVLEVPLAGSLGKRSPSEMSLQYVSLPGQEPHLLAIIRDISERKKSQEQIRYAAFHDALTGLPNRLLFTERLIETMSDSKEKHKKFAVLFLDVDRFKFINDILGHLVGDLLLEQVAKRLKASIKRNDTVARLGGDEFVILLNNIQSEKNIEAVAGRIIKAFQQPFTLAKQEIYVNVSVGISSFPKDGKDPETLLKNADNALYRAKQQGGSNHHYYNEGMFIPQLSHLQLEKQLRQAISNNELRLHYQPVFDLKTGHISSVEALMRWEHPTLGLVMPGDFISQAEESGLIVQIGEWAFKEVCRQLQIWRKQKIGVPVSVNMSPRELVQRNLLPHIKRTLKEYKLTASDIELELTETFLIKNMEASTGILEQFRDLGFRVLIDDFGTGYASLNYLKRLPIDYIKIDQSFIRDCVTSSQDAGIIEAIIAMAHHLNLKVVAEGVETEAQLKFLESRKCDLIQGHYYSPALPADDMTKIFHSVNNKI